MPTGTVKWFNNAKGYGFILSDQDQSDIFAHFSAIEMEGYRTLKAGQHVEFEQVDGDKGAQALSISVSGSSSVEANDASIDTSENEPVTEEPLADVVN